MKKRKILALGLSLTLGLGSIGSGFSYRSYAETSNSNNSIKNLYLYETVVQHVQRLYDFNLSYSRGEEFRLGIINADSKEEIEKLYNEAYSESKENEKKFPERTYRMIGEKKSFVRNNLTSIEVSDEGVAIGHYEKERVEISKEHYDFFVDELNKATTRYKISLLREIYRNEILVDSNLEQSPEYPKYEEELERPEEGEFDEKPEDIKPEADKTLLKKLLDKKYKKEDYTEDSYKFYTMIHTASKKVYDDKEAYQSDVDKALTNLNTAINLLEKVEKTEENKDVKENSEDKNKPATDKEKPEKNINKKIEEAIHRIEVKLGGLKYIKEAMPETYKRYKDIMDDAIVDTEKALKQAKEFLKN